MKKAFIETNTVNLTGMFFMNLENWPSWELYYCRKSSLNFIVQTHKTLRTSSISSCKIHFLLSLSSADFQLGLIYSPICSRFKVLSVLFSCHWNVSYIFPVCLTHVSPSLPPHLAFISVLFYSSLYNLQGRSPIFLIVCIYTALDTAIGHLLGKKRDIWQSNFTGDSVSSCRVGRRMKCATIVPCNYTVWLSQIL